MQRLLVIAGLLSYAVAADIERRQAVASTQCAGRDNTWAICSPAAGETWYNGSYHEFTWKYDNSVFTSYSTLILYLLQANSNGTYTTAKTWQNVSRTPGVLVEQVDNTWFPSQLLDNSPNRTWSMAAYIMPPGMDIQADLAKIPSQENRFPPPVQFDLIQNSYNTTRTSPTIPTSSFIAPSNSANNELQPWMIAVISLASIIVAAAVSLLAFFFYRRKQRKEDARQYHGEIPSEKVEAFGLSPPLPPDFDSIHSSTPMMLHAGSREVISPSPSNRHITEDLHSSQLSSTDAHKIADKFRELMRKPDWNEIVDDDDDDLEKPAGSGSMHNVSEQALPIDSRRSEDNDGLATTRNDAS